MLFAELSSLDPTAALTWQAWVTISVVVAAFLLAAMTQYATDMVFLAALTARGMRVGRAQEQL